MKPIHAQRQKEEQGPSSFSSVELKPPGILGQGGMRGATGSPETQSPEHGVDLTPPLAPGADRGDPPEDTSPPAAP